MEHSQRIYNLSAGPAILPEPVLFKLQDALINYNGSGLGIAEISHRSDIFEAVNESAQNGLRSLLSIPDDYEILFVQGGATAQFAALPLHFASGTKTLDYIDTGIWSQKAFAQAKLYGNAVVCSSGKENNYRSIPATFEPSPDARYLHFTSNNTIYGTQFSEEPSHKAQFLACDASSDILSRPLDISKYGLLYASTQKNVGIAGLTIVILRKSLLDDVTGDPPQILDYRNYAKSKSLFNTPPTLAIYCVKEICDWIKGQGGLSAMQSLARERSKLLYDVIDSEDVFEGVADTQSRSTMNITWRFRDDSHNEKFLMKAQAAGFWGLAGHRSAGGMRASMYNAFPLDGATKLAAFMKEFADQL